MKAIIFDFDGTLADTLPMLFVTFRDVFKTYDGVDYTDEEIKQMFGPPETGVIMNNLKSIERKKAVAYFYQRYDDLHDDYLAVDHAVNAMLTRLSEHASLGIMTGKARRSLDISLQRLNMEGIFSTFICGDDIEKPKPDPEGVLKAMEELGASADETIFTGDSDADVTAGLKAGVTTVGAQWLDNLQTTDYSLTPHHISTSLQDFEAYCMTFLRK
ncbi:HAD family hydrolase [Salisediminibacterium halotolerans]|uniref:Phosphoglycolate phosphatase/pyrophosphatase PpaX n=1 Tax=Salisediminibacterium halotolerans TaxID=517425 RepID=A0A1H9WGN2_9BACI|nr:HAD family hydrolase [Salisediminibacterium haloalkalitolerans]SES33102.1 phosphoglycolate phosphatase/pyrophosphatase PpaX [Salisediminibacterium haloalkalitolerans]